MNKQKRANCKKTLVRNTERPVSKCTIVINESEKSSKKISTASSQDNLLTKKKSDKQSEKSCKDKETKLDLPELYSTLSISKKIDKVVQPRKVKSCSDVDQNLAIDEKVTRKINFPYDQPIYKDLIPLTCKNVRTQQPPSRNPLPPKDKAPVLSDFLTPRQTSDFKYYFAPTIKIDKKPPIITSANLRLYKTLQKFD